MRCGRLTTPAGIEGTAMARARIALVTAATVALLAASAGHAGGADATREAAILDAILVANGVASDDVRAASVRRIQSEIDRIVAASGDGRPGWRRAARLHRRLHRDYLTTYRADADGLLAVIDDGTYNCVSATLFYGLVAHRLGYGVRVLEYPGHLLLRLRMRGRRVDVETTDPDGYDLSRFPGWAPPAGPLTAAAPGEPFGPPLPGVTFWEVELEQAVGFAWLNRAWRLHDRGQPRAAAAAAGAALRHLPGGGASEELVIRLLSQAFRESYEVGDFETAFVVASHDVELFPGRTTSRDRLFAAGLKRVEAAADRGAISAAEAVVTRVRTLAGGDADVERFERLTTPLIAAAAVREERWDAALAAAARFAAVEPDRVEAERLARWIDRRRAAAASAESPACDGVESFPLLGRGADSVASPDATR